MNRQSTGVCPFEQKSSSSPQKNLGSAEMHLFRPVISLTKKMPNTGTGGEAKREIFKKNKI